MSFLMENLSYKLIALVVTLVLWLSMIGSKDSVLTKDYQLQVLLPANTELAHPVPDYVRVEVVGPRVALKKLGQMSSMYTVDLSNASVGQMTVRLTPEGVNLPLGTRVVSVDPREFVAVIQPIPSAAKKSQAVEGDQEK
jgi:YbbR domain-containing protein